MCDNRFGLSAVLALVVVAVQVRAGPIVNEHQKLTGDLESSFQFGRNRLPARRKLL